MILRLLVGRLWLLAVFLLLLGLSPITNLLAHGIRPALLQITERNPGLFDVTWKVPARGNRVLGLKPVFPPGFNPVAPPSSHTIPGAWVEYTTYNSDGRSLAGETISIEGLSATLTEALLRVRLIDGSTYSTILRPSAPSFTFPAPKEEHPVKVILQNVRRALGHLAGGVNHSLLILVLVLLAGGAQALKVLIAFVLGHGASLVIADLGILGFPPALAEVLCAVAVIVVARSVVLGRRDLMPFMAPVFLVGLFHGLGYARVLAEAGTTKPGLLQALFAFNLGLDLGQILMTVLVVCAVMAARRLKGFEKTRTFAAYAVGISAAAIGIGTFMGAIGPSQGDQRSQASRVSVSGLESPMGPRGAAPSVPGSRTQPLPQLKDPLAVFLVIEPYEVRLEALLRARDLDGLSQLKPIEGQMIQPDAQEPLIRDLLTLVGNHVSVIINGKKASPALQRGEFVTVGSYGILTRKQQVPEQVDKALIGMTFVYETDRLPREVFLDWGLFLPGAKQVTVTMTDPFGGRQTVLTPAATMLRWQNRLTGFKVPVIKSVPVLLPRVPAISLALLLVSLTAFVIGARRGHSWTLKGLGITCIALAIVVYPFVRTPLELPGSRAFKPTHEEATDILHGLLANVYRSFDLRNEDAVYDRLALTVSGDQLTNIYLQSRRAMELEDRGGARGKVDDVDVGEVQDVKREADGTFSVDANWTVSGSVSHFGHTHYRKNRYHAVVNIVPEGDAWKIRSLTLLDERRLL